MIKCCCFFSQSREINPPLTASGATYVILKREITGNVTERYYNKPLGKFKMFFCGVGGI